MMNFFTSTVTAAGLNSIKMVLAMSVASFSMSFQLRPSPNFKSRWDTVFALVIYGVGDIVAARGGGEIELQFHGQLQPLCDGALGVGHADAEENFQVNDGNLGVHFLVLLFLLDASFGIFAEPDFCFLLFQFLPCFSTA